MSKPSKRTSIVMPLVEEVRTITAAAKADPDAQPLTPAQLTAMVPARALRGRPPLESKKQLVSIPTPLAGRGFKLTWAFTKSAMSPSSPNTG